MKKSLALIAAVAALALPMSAQAHRAWLAPTATVLSGTDAWVGFDAGMSNGVFISDHAAMNLAGLVITAPDGSTAQAENMMRGRYRSTFDLHLTQPGTWKVANVMSGIMATYTENGEQKRWRGQAAEFPGALPADGLVLIPVTHPNDLVAGEPATFKLSIDGLPASGQVTVNEPSAPVVTVISSGLSR